MDFGTFQVDLARPIAELHEERTNTYIDYWRLALRTGLLWPKHCLFAD